MSEDFLGDLSNDEGELTPREVQGADGKKYLLEAVSYQRDIEPYGLTEIISGLGSGKNYFVNKLSAGVKKGEDGALEDIEKKTVLLITSRRAKADEVRSDKSVTMVASVDAWESAWALDTIEDIDEYLQSERKIEKSEGNWGTTSVIHQPSTAWTGAGLQHYLMHHYNPQNSTTHLWNRFDLIVIDEVHSVVADASYQSAPFYVQALVNEVYRRYQAGETKCRVVIMTGSPNILKDYTYPRNTNRLDMREECINTVPKRVVFVTKEQAKTILKERLNSGERAAYYFNHIGDMLSLAEDYKGTTVYEKTAISFSDEDRRTALMTDLPSLHARMVATEQHIMVHQRLPEEIQLFLSTGKNKEGINIKNENITALFVESHAEVDIVQIAGRIRKGVDVLYIVTDSAQHGKKEKRFEYRLSSREDLLKIINDELGKVAKADGIDLHRNTIGRKSVGQYPVVSAYIRYIHEKFPYIKYDYFKDEFALYSQRGDSISYYDEQQRIFVDSISSSDKLEQLAGTWFPGVPVTVLSNIQEQVDEYLESNHWLNGERAIKNEERILILADLNRITGENSKQLKTLLRHYGYLLTTHGKKTWSTSDIVKIPDSGEGEVA